MSKMRKEYDPNKVKRRKRKPIVYIICEGKETETLYFKHFRSRNCLVDIIRKMEISFGVYSIVMIIKTLSFKPQFLMRRSMGTKSHIPIQHLSIGICSILKNGMDI